MRLAYFLTRAVALCILLWGGTRPGFAGPPLAIDDPGILDPGQWEFIVATTYTEATGGTSYEFPIIDISYGITDNIQVSAAIQHVFVNPDEGSSANDWGNPAIGVKWRFVDTPRLQLAIAPGFSFGVSSTRASLGLADDDDVAFIPLELQYALGDWTLNGELGYLSVEKDTDLLGYGVAISRPLITPHTQVFLEFYGASETDLDNDVLNFHLAFDHAFTTAWHLLFAIGSGLREPDGTEEVDLDMYLGVQYFR